MSIDLAVITPASSFETSSNAENSASNELTDVLIRLTSAALSGSLVRSVSAAENNPSACSGCRRSWLAAARKRDFE